MVITSTASPTIMIHNNESFIILQQVNSKYLQNISETVGCGKLVGMLVGGYRCVLLWCDLNFDL